MVDGTPRCRGLRKDGTPCAAPPHTIGETGYCWAHDPARRAERHAARARGGRNHSTAARVEAAPLPSYLRPILQAVIRAIVDVREGTLSPAQGSSIAALAGVAVRLVAADVFEARIAALEAAHAAKGDQTA